MAVPGIVVAASQLNPVIASSRWNHDLDVDRARLNYSGFREGGGSWAAAVSDESQFLQFLFGGNCSQLLEIATQGRSDYDQWVKSYRVMYTIDGINWSLVADGKVFEANTDRNTIVKN